MVFLVGSAMLRETEAGRHHEHRKEGDLAGSRTGADFGSRAVSTSVRPRTKSRRTSMSWRAAPIGDFARARPSTLHLAVQPTIAKLPCWYDTADLTPSGCRAGLHTKKLWLTPSSR